MLVLMTEILNGKTCHKSEGMCVQTKMYIVEFSGML
jgi:hypothetical protein